VVIGVGEELADVAELLSLDVVVVFELCALVVLAVAGSCAQITEKTATKTPTAVAAMRTRIR
jgi:hypothetical protein